MLFGAHVSIAGGLENAPLNAKKIGCEIFQMFTRSPQGGWVAPLNKAIAKKFKANCKTAGQSEWYIHAPYFINFASANSRIKHGSISAIRTELDRGSIIGAKYVMAHLGSYKDLGPKAGFKQLVEGLSAVLRGYQGSTELLIEVSAGAGAIIGNSFEEIAKIIHHPILKRSRLGVCYDTQHGFASGYDIRTSTAVAETLSKMEATFGLENLKMSHGNDSKTEFNSHRDRHEHIGEGKIGLAGFTAIVANAKFKKINLICETEPDKAANDIKILKKIRKNTAYE